MTNYVIQKESTAHCPICHARMDLLTPKWPRNNNEIMFYICWKDQHVAQVGVGPVPRSPEEVE